MKWVFVVILVAAVLHVLEEYAWPGGFPAFMKRMAPRFAPAVTTPFAVVVNGAFLLLCVVAAVVGRAVPVFGLSVAALLIVNALTHIGGGIRARRYAPGLVTSVLLYVPLGVYAFQASLAEGWATIQQTRTAVLLGLAYAAVPPLWLGLAYLIKRRGPRWPAMLLLLPFLCLVACQVTPKSERIPVAAATAQATPLTAPTQASVGIIRRSSMLCPADMHGPPGKALFLAYNFTKASWDVTFGPYTLRVPAYRPGEGYAVASLAFEPGTYRWQAQTPDDGGAFISDPEGDIALEFTVEPGDLLFARVMSLNPATSTLRWVVEPEISHCEGQ